MKHFLSIEIQKLFCYNTNTFAGMVELADTQDLGSCGQPCRFKSCYPHQKNSSCFCTGCFFITGLEPEKVSAFGKCAGGTFLAGSAKAVSHAKRGVSRAGSMQGAAAADGQVLLSAPKKQFTLLCGLFFCKNCLTFICYFFHNFSF